MNTKFDTSFSSSILLCQETEEACFSETATECYETVYSDHYKSCFVSDNEDDEYIQNLAVRETDVGFKTNPSTCKTCLQSARSDAIQWIYNTRETFGFQLHTAYLSVTYFDRFISIRSIDEDKMWAVRLLSIACLSLAAKMEECEVPILSEFYTKDYQFQNKVIQRMELLVLSTLEWKMNPITPFSYLHYFIRKFHSQSNPKGFISKALELILSITKEINLVDYRPSIVAAAAVLAASNSGLTRKAMVVKIDFIPLWGSSQSEEIYGCYRKMVEIEKRKCKTPKLVITSNYSSVHNVVVKGISDVSHGGGTKRNLIFNESDQDSLAKKICRP
ncbi:BTB/POZ and TAZ domain-containing protein 4-like isoform X1 [Hibiscus syriacus]|uniref:BTB/POZ and TAZ domain-containing protein 4-like isoform X1 n=1 Tax=Hibiscus syriacus TaxID=106335 RepID=A0A6A3ASK7_HIBSY|nr:BTB/POZ and TAZ domain-containing protein 4-like isoform X1 [Hibiscus syriacus]